MKIISVVGARPNFMKIAPFIRAINNHNKKSENTINHLLVHTGQHYDDRMSESFFKDLNIPPADINLEIGSGTHAEQVGNTMIAFEKVLITEKPDWVVVVGDVNATLACSVTAKKMHIKVCHIEAGLRSGDITMPEEVNRLVTDRLSDILLVPDRMSIQNLKAEGTDDKRIIFAGNIMIDTLEQYRHKAEILKIAEIIQNNQLQDNSLKTIPGDFALMTLHRPSNVDDKNVLTPIINFLLEEITIDMPIIWAIHPRTQKQLKLFGLWEKVIGHPKMILLHPLGYLEMLRLNMGARIMLTDSGGLQEECTVLGTPCITLRWNTERPITLEKNGGVSLLVGNNVQMIRKEYKNILKKDVQPVIPEFWDGKAAERCLNSILFYQS